MFRRTVIALLFIITCASARFKRGVSFDSFPQDFTTFDSASYSKSLAPSPVEIAAAIQAAKEASANVMAAQRRVQQAKEDVLNQYNMSNQKQAQAALALKRTEAAAALQQQEAKSAANALIQAQQRLASVKAEVVELQRIAAAQEARAAAVIQKSAAAAAEEARRIDDAARKLSTLKSSNVAAAAKQGALTAPLAAEVGRTGGGNIAWVWG